MTYIVVGMTTVVEPLSALQTIRLASWRDFSACCSSCVRLGFVGFGLYVSSVVPSSILNSMSSTGSDCSGGVQLDREKMRAYCSSVRGCPGK